MNLGGRFLELTSFYSRVASFVSFSPRLALLCLFLPLTHAAASQLTLAWNDNSSDESGFKIERSANGGTFTQIASVGANTTTYVDSGLTGSTQYSYRVRAFNSAGNSAFSNSVSYTTPSATNTAPTIGTIANQTIEANSSTSAIGFTIGDAETAAGNLTLKGTSSNTTLVPTSNVAFGGSGGNRTVSVTPAADKSGTATITVTVSDGALSASRSFTLTVNAVPPPPSGSNTAPAITALSDQTINADGTATQSFKVSDVETSAGSLVVTGTSSNTTLVPAGGITFTANGPNRSITVKPATGRSGTATITVKVSDGSLSASRSFALTVNSTVSNTSPTVGGVDDQVLQPGVSSSPLPFTVSDAETAAGSLTVNAGSSNVTLVPASGITLGGSGGNRTITIKPAANQTGSAVITILVSDGSLQGSTTFNVTVGAAKVGNSAPAISAVENQTIVQNNSTSALGFKVSDVETSASNLAVTVHSSNTALVPLSGVKLGGSGSDRTVTVTPAKNQTGTTIITLLVKDTGGLTTSTNFEVAVLSTSNGAPDISTHPVSQTVKTGASVTFSVTATATPSPSYQWRKDGTPINGATSATLTLNKVDLNSMGAYDVVVRNNKGSVTSDSAVLAVNLPNLTGTYFGTFSSGGTWALYVRADYTATYLATVPSRVVTLVLELALAKDGSFTVSSSKVTALGTTSAQASSFNGTSSDNRFASSTDVSLKGQIVDGQVVGQLLNLGMDFSGQADAESGPARALAGYTTASGGSSNLYSIVGSSGQTVMVITTASQVDSATGVTQASGKFVGTTALGGQMESSTDLTKLTVSATYVASGSSVNLVGRAEHAPSASRFINVAIRTKVDGSRPLMTGFVVRGETRKNVLVRGVGPTLADYGVSSVLADPVLSLYEGPALSASNDDWGSEKTTPELVQASSRVGAFPLVSNSRDSVLLANVGSGSYTAHISGKNGSSGVALVELYDADVAGTSRLVNVSARSQVGAGDDVMIVGFVIAGEGPRRVLIRAVAPSMAELFGVSGTLADPYLRLYQGSTLVSENDNWGGSDTVSAAFSTAGAFQLSGPASKDAAILVTLQPGVYSAMVSGVNGGTGEALLELYEMP